MNCNKIFAALASAIHRRRWPRRGAALIALLATRLCPTAQGLDFRLSTVSVMFDGYRAEQPFIHYDETNAVYLVFPGASWSATGEPNSLTLTSSKFTGGQIRLEKSSSSASDTDFKVKTALDDYRRRAVAALPQGASAITVAAERDMPAGFFEWRDYEFVLDYAFFGQPYRRGTIFLDLNAKEQIVVTYSAPPASFDAVRSMALRVLRSWRVVPLSPESQPKTDAGR